MVLAPLLLPLLPLLAALVLLGLSQTASATQGTGFWQGLADALSGRALLRQALQAVVAAARWIVSHTAGAQLKHLAAYFNALATLFKQEFRALRENAAASVAAEAEIQASIPRVARKAAHPARVAARRAQTTADHALSKARADGRALDRYKGHVNPRLAHATHAVDVTLPRDIARVRSREEALSRDQARLRERTNALEDGALDLWKWIRTHPLSATTGVFAGAVAIALGRLGLGGLRCRNFTNLLKREGCGFGTLLGRLLPLAALL
ncbi:MAG TPA: hypothetical protein VKA83_00735, partial [Methylomirabilota bacterium]|nr:hypothetical protein [Methylomirabilota bacterium]